LLIGRDLSGGNGAGYGSDGHVTSSFLYNSYCSYVVSFVFATSDDLVKSCGRRVPPI